MNPKQAAAFFSCSVILFMLCAAFYQVGYSNGHSEAWRDGEERVNHIEKLWQERETQLTEMRHPPPALVLSPTDNDLAIQSLRRQLADVRRQVQYLQLRPK